MTEIDITRTAFNLDKQNLKAILNVLPIGVSDTGYKELFVGTSPLDSNVTQWLIEVARLEVARQLQSVRADLETHEERIAMLEQQTQSTDTEAMSYRTIPTIQTTQQRLWAMGQEGRLRALEYDGDPIEELRNILPENLSADEWQNIVSGAYD